MFDGHSQRKASCNYRYRMLHYVFKNTRTRLNGRLHIHALKYTHNSLISTYMHVHTRMRARPTHTRLPRMHFTRTGSQRCLCYDVKPLCIALCMPQRTCDVHSGHAVESYRWSVVGMATVVHDGYRCGEKLYVELKLANCTIFFSRSNVSEINPILI